MSAPRLKVLSPHEAKIVDAIAEVLFPPSSVFKKPLSEIPIAREVDAHLSRVNPLMRLDYKLGLWFIEISLLLSRLRLFSKSSLELRMKRWDRLWRSRFYPLKLLLRLVSSVCYFVYYSDPEIEGSVGYRKPPTRPAGRIPSGPLVQTLENDETVTTEVCIIGSGAGGGVVARSLAERGKGVVVLEEGGYCNSDSFRQLPIEVVRQAYRVAGMYATVGLPVILVPTGRAVGGTTVINSGTCFRLPETVLENWREQFRLKELHYRDLIPYFETIERNLQVGPVTEALQGNHSRLIAKGLAALGYDGGPLVRDAPGCEGSGHCCFGCPTDAKQSLHLSYIPQALAAGARIYARCEAKRIVPQGQNRVTIRATGQTAGGNKRTLTVNAQVLVIAGGTLNTPQLIRRNRLLPGNRHVGRHISLHPAATVKALFKEKVEAWKGVPQGYWIDLMRKEGITFEGAFTPPGVGSVATGVDRGRHRELMEQYDRLAAFGFMLTDHSGGRLYTLPKGESLLSYSVQKSDLGKYQEGIAFLVDVYAAAGATRIYPCLHSLLEVRPEEGGDAIRRLKLKRTDLELSAFHPLGSCRMGTDESNSVVDSYGKMHRYRHLYIADGSIFPSSLGVNPQVTIMAFAHRIADYIAAKGHS